MPEMIGKPCKSCGRAVFWVTMVSGKKMPLDTDPKLIQIHVGKDRWKTVRGYEAHWYSCPQAEEWRKSKRG